MSIYKLFEILRLFLETFHMPVHDFASHSRKRLELPSFFLSQTIRPILLARFSSLTSLNVQQCCQAQEIGHSNQKQNPPDKGNQAENRIQAYGY